MRKLRLTFLVLLGMLFLSIPAFAEDPAKATKAPSTTEQEAAKTLAKLNGAMDEVGTWVKATGQFALEQAPLLVKEVLYWQIALQGFLVLLGALMVGYALWGWRWCYKQGTKHLEMAREHTKLLKEKKRAEDKYTGETEDVIFSFTHYAIPSTAVVLGIVGIIMFLYNVPDLLKPIVAPRLFLIEYFRTFLS